MNESGFLLYLFLGQPDGTGSWVQRLDPRTRLLGFATLMTALIAARNLVPALALVIMVAGLVRLARVPPRFAWRAVRALVPWLVFVAAIQLLFGIGNGPSCESLLGWGPWRLTSCSLTLAALTWARFIGLVMLVGLLAWTSPVPDLARGLEALARPLDRLNLPAHQVALASVIAMRFLPTMALEMDRIQKAQTARGAALAPGRANFVQRVRRTLPLIVPLFVLALRRAERLAEAMEARAYSGGQQRSSYHRLRFGRPDWIALGFMILVLAGVLLAGLWMP